MDKAIWIAILAGHFGVFAASRTLGRKRGKPLGGGSAFCLLIPVFGPVCGLILALSGEADTGLLQDLIHSDRMLRRDYIAPEAEAPVAAPMEETFLIQTPQVRRNMMMRMLHSDPEENVRLLMMARFNDDPETAHYATASLTEYQRKLELDLQQSQMILAKDPENIDERRLYIRRIRTYLDSGLLEGHLLQRQRLLLEEELEKLPEAETDMELCALRVRNLLALGKAAGARETAERMISAYPAAEEPYLELMRVYVDTHDARGLRGLKERLEYARVLWSHRGREKMAYVLGGLNGDEKAEGST